MLLRARQAGGGGGGFVAGSLHAHLELPRPDPKPVTRLSTGVGALGSSAALSARRRHWAEKGKPVLQRVQQQQLLALDGKDAAEEQKRMAADGGALAGDHGHQFLLAAFADLHGAGKAAHPGR